MKEATDDVVRLGMLGLTILVTLLGDWLRRRRNKRNARLSEVLRRPTE